MILLDTNVLSEMMHPRPDPLVSAWVDNHPAEELWTASIVLAELHSGVDLMPIGRRQKALREAVEDMIVGDLRARILRFDENAARHYGQIFSHRQKIGHPIKEMDALIAAIALTHGATLATRNIPDFEHCGIPLVNPWQAG
jgi:predicted nucleic acid-binding protein